MRGFTLLANLKPESETAAEENEKVAVKVDFEKDISKVNSPHLPILECAVLGLWPQNYRYPLKSKSCGMECNLLEAEEAQLELMPEVAVAVKSCI